MLRGPRGGRQRRGAHLSQGRLAFGRADYSHGPSCAGAGVIPELDDPPLHDKVEVNLNGTSLVFVSPMKIAPTCELQGRDLCPPLRLPKITNLKSPITDNKFRKQTGPIYLLFSET